MKLDWKRISKSTGYKSMKKEVVDYTNKAKRLNWGRDDEYQKKFEFIINRAKHYTVKTIVLYTNDRMVNTTAFIKILDEWEEKRTYCFINYYSSYRQPKLFKEKFKPNGLKGTIKRYQKEKRWTADEISIQIQYRISVMRKENATKKPIRWLQWQKDSAKRMREYEAKKSV